MAVISSPIKRNQSVNYLYKLLAEQSYQLIDITWAQHLFHEQRRWSAVELLQRVDFEVLSPADKINIWNAGRAELTTKPGADRLARLAETESQRWLEQDPPLAAAIQACGTWSRYWNEEESFHETTLNHLSKIVGFETVNDETFMEFRKIFPDDDLLRTLVLLAFSEITASVNYATCANMTKDPGLRALFKQISSDESQHLSYFISFAKALVDSGKYPVKNAFAIAHFFLREGGELQGSQRSVREVRETHVNWWDALDYDWDQMPDNTKQKEGLIFSALRQITGISVKSIPDVEATWLELVGC